MLATDLAKSRFFKKLNINSLSDRNYISFDEIEENGYIRCICILWITIISKRVTICSKEKSGLEALRLIYSFIIRQF